MSQRGVERTLGKLVTDQDFRTSFFRDPAGASLKIGVELTRDEVSALLRIPPRALDDLYVTLDDRICKLAIGRETLGQEARP
jgi:hypothetical protein